METEVFHESTEQLIDKKIVLSIIHKMKQTIICLAGRKRSGKESVFKLMYPYVANPREFQFAEPLKKFCIDTLGLTREQCYGGDSDRESPTKYKWGFVSKEIRERYGKQAEEVMTARDVLQVVGTDLVRDQFYVNTWAEAGVRNTIGKATTCIFSDTRFPNEIEAIFSLSQEYLYNRPVICRLYRETGLVDLHKSESALDIYDVRPNQRCILGSDHHQLISDGYRLVMPNLWEAANVSFYDFLIDNNSTLENLKNAVAYILKSRQLLQDVSLS